MTTLNTNPLGIYEQNFTIEELDKSGHTMLCAIATRCEKIVARIRKDIEAYLRFVDGEAVEYSVQQEHGWMPQKRALALICEIGGKRLYFDPRDSTTFCYHEYNEKEGCWVATQGAEIAWRSIPFRLVFGGLTRLSDMAQQAHDDHMGSLDALAVRLEKQLDTMERAGQHADDQSSL